LRASVSSARNRQKKSQNENDKHNLNWATLENGHLASPKKGG
jgi:hypothetical protein